MQTISEKQIRPISAWVSRLRNGAYWGGVLLLVSLSAVATAVSWHVVFEIDWLAYGKAHFSWLEVLLSGVPFFSLLLLAVFLLVSIVFLHQTRRGYRYPLPLLAGMFFFGSLACGFFLEVSPFDQPVERLFLRAFPHVEKIQATLLPSAERQWSQPEHGLLGGSVLSSDATDMTLLDTSQKLWTVDYSRATVEAGVSLDPHEQVKVIGDQKGTNTFQATEVRVWEKSHGGKWEEARKKSREESALQKNAGTNTDPGQNDAELLPEKDSGGNGSSAAEDGEDGGQDTTDEGEGN